jgi:hypothetical protein
MVSISRPEPEDPSRSLPSSRNADAGVTWLHSYVSEDHSRAFCVYDGPSPEAIRKAAARNGLPVEWITQVRVLDPYFYPRDRKESEGTGRTDTG